VSGEEDWFARCEETQSLWCDRRVEIVKVEDVEITKRIAQVEPVFDRHRLSEAELPGPQMDLPANLTAQAAGVNGPLKAPQWSARERTEVRHFVPGVAEPACQVFGKAACAASAEHRESA
jgi:hypothetical protein